ncbi:aminotransferase class V-fold PLP-dependent enzyme [Geochorda subterranea]|uniref:Aminotransferase class V-fold PLP-dependent enzyme n=1 Tax=Geochorda subterranea TaxID=3109564 RepID=A0ABZ1BPS4_9FIRM|nr:aminotransferase class V-fold PLP-dependent enzyme [Limnochorda sp. LNt]WRP14473.1 aminotransferase class V-fold PLP-dependent enzyme [Limnochorda sp. LNt]
MRDIYADLGMPRLVNAAGTYTVFGGSRMPREVIEAMVSAASSFTRIQDFQARVHARIAELTRNEGAYVTCGCAAGLYLAAAAAVSLRFGKPFRWLKSEEVANSEVVVYRAHRNPYDWAVRQLGVRLVEVGYPNTIDPPTVDELEASITQRTVAIFYTMSGWTAPGALPLKAVIEVARRHRVPVVVDAAAQLPPVENLWSLTQAGADAAVFSGGKDLRGPQSTGLVLGRRQFVEAIAETGFPTYGIGRMLKVGREELAGLMAAVERYVKMDHAARLQWCERQVRLVIERVEAGGLGLQAIRTFPNEAGQPIPRALVRKPGALGWAAAVRDALLAGDPAIAVTLEGEDGVYINPMTLEEGEAELVVDRLLGVAARL